MNVWNVLGKCQKRIRLWRTEPGKFIVNEQGEYAAILENATYTLIHKKFGDILQKYADQVKITSAFIEDRVLKTENHDYVELQIFNTINVKDIQTITSTSDNIWVHGGYLFVSDEVKSQLEEVNNSELEFHLGFSMFGGI